MSGVGGSIGFLHGPYHRKQNPNTQPESLAYEQARSHALLGKAARGSHFLSAKAYIGVLPAGEHGIEFYSLTRHHGTHPFIAYWYKGHQDVWEVTRNSESFAMIVIQVKKIDYP